ncbi:cobalamin-dependent protein [Desulfurispirillum indicum]|uniref:cobalamin B12-binding domain-containing protein n=1 Tax=Desulfurispirillum indicum TaxID=936456 RepID=UPI001CFC0378|nr:cobalamin-dependent protein [Desulfurispirillum indicum]UCZ55849.1 cobalamin-dependent protein [Desulfurispirillum indicum]
MNPQNNPHSPISRQPDAVIIPETNYQAFLKVLLQGDRSSCHTQVESMLRQDTPIRAIYVELFQRALYEVGALWEANRISVAVEHLATAIVESLLGTIYPRLFAAERTGRKAVISCVAGEYHQIGGRMVADTFEMCGWDGYFLGANTPMEELCHILLEKKPNMLALSLSVFFNLHHLHTAIARIRTDMPEIPIIVGGQAFRWGGRDIGSTYSGVRYIPTLQHLERVLHQEYAP